MHVLSLPQNKFGLVFFPLFDGALETSNFRFEEVRSAITLFRCFLHENTQRGKIARVKFAKELSTISKNRLRWITLVRGPIWGISLSHLDDLLVQLVSQHTHVMARQVARNIVQCEQRLKTLRDKLKRPLRKVELGSTCCNDFNQLSSMHYEMCENLCDVISPFKAIEFMFAGKDMFWTRLRHILAGAIRREIKWGQRRTQNIFMPQNMNCITIIITIRDWRALRKQNLKKRKKWQQNSLKFFFFTDNLYL